MTPFLDPLACRETIKTLEAIESKREPTGEAVRQEEEWARKTFGLLANMSLKVVSAVANRPSPINPASEKFIKRGQDLQRQTGFLLIDLAARAFELEKGRRPQSTKELVPDYLKAVPKDPTTGTDLALPK